MVVLIGVGLVNDSCDIRSYHVLIESGVLGVNIGLSLTLYEVLLGDGDLESCCIDRILVRVVQAGAFCPSY